MKEIGAVFYIETSAKYGTGIEEVIVCLIIDVCEGS